MKVAAITDDGTTISQHFGRAEHYMVVTVNDGAIVERELRPKMGHTHFTQVGEHGGHSSAAGHGMDAASHDKHLQMAQAITDCEALLCRGMGRGAYLSMEQAGIRPVVTDIVEIDQAVLAYARGEIQDLTDRLH